MQEGTWKRSAKNKSWRVCSKEEVCGKGALLRYMSWRSSTIGCSSVEQGTRQISECGRPFIQASTSSTANISNDKDKDKGKNEAKTVMIKKRVQMKEQSKQPNS